MTPCQITAQQLLKRMNLDVMPKGYEFVFSRNEKEFSGIGFLDREEHRLVCTEPNGNEWECEAVHVESVINLCDGTLPSYFYRVSVVY